MSSQNADVNGRFEGHLAKQSISNEYHVNARGRFLVPADFDDIKVRLCNSKGEYLAAAPDGWTFCKDCEKAFVFDYVGDRVEEYLASIARFRGIVLKATPVDPKEFLEVCDRCQQVVAPAAAFFDGTRFLCPRCRGKRGTNRLVI
jgi:hypothetical protein